MFTDLSSNQHCNPQHPRLNVSYLSSEPSNLLISLHQRANDKHCEIMIIMNISNCWSHKVHIKVGIYTTDIRG